MENNIEFVLSKRGLPCLWECGGATSNKGSAIIIASSKGEPKEALCLGSHSNGQHALIPVQIGDYIVCSHQFHLEFSFRLLCSIHFFILMPIFCAVFFFSF